VNYHIILNLIATSACEIIASIAESIANSEDSASLLVPPPSTHRSFAFSRLDAVTQDTYLPRFPRQIGNIVALFIASFTLLRGIRTLGTLMGRKFRRQIGISVEEDVAVFSPVILVQLAVKIRHPGVNEPVQVVHPTKKKEQGDKHTSRMIFARYRWQMIATGYFATCSCAGHRSPAFLPAMHERYHVRHRSSHVSIVNNTQHIADRVHCPVHTRTCWKREGSTITALEDARGPAVTCVSRDATGRALSSSIETSIPTQLHVARLSATQPPPPSSNSDLLMSDCRSFFSLFLTAE